MRLFDLASCLLPGRLLPCLLCRATREACRSPSPVLPSTEPDPGPWPWLSPPGLELQCKLPLARRPRADSRLLGSGKVPATSFVEKAFLWLPFCCKAPSISILRQRSGLMGLTLTRFTPEPRFRLLPVPHKAALQDLVTLGSLVVGSSHLVLLKKPVQNVTVEISFLTRYTSPIPPSPILSVIL